MSDLPDRKKQSKLETMLSELQAVQAELAGQDHPDRLLKSRATALKREIKAVQAAQLALDGKAKIRDLEREERKRRIRMLGTALHDVDLTENEAQILAGVLNRLADKPSDWHKLKKWTHPRPGKLAVEEIEFQPTRPKIPANA